jgi:hypothetical protein
MKRLIIISILVGAILMAGCTTESAPVVKETSSPVSRESFPYPSDVTFGCPGCPASAYDWALETCKANGSNWTVQIGESGPSISCDAILRGVNSS